MTREIVLLIYRFGGPIVLALTLIVVLDELGMVQLNERSLPGPLYTLAVVIMFAAVFAIPLYFIFAGMTVFRFWGDWTLIAPSAFPMVAACALLAAVAWPETDTLAKWVAGASIIFFGLTATWVGWFSR